MAGFRARHCERRFFEMEILYVLYNILSTVMANLWLFVARTLFYL